MVGRAREFARSPSSVAPGIVHVARSGWGFDNTRRGALGDRDSGARAGRICAPPFR